MKTSAILMTVIVSFVLSSCAPYQVHFHVPPGHAASVAGITAEDPRIPQYGPSHFKFKFLPDFVFKDLAWKEEGNNTVWATITIQNAGSSYSAPPICGADMFLSTSDKDGNQEFKYIKSSTAIPKLSTGETAPVLCKISGTLQTIKSAGGVWVITIDPDNVVPEGDDYNNKAFVDNK